jgi:signal transduction histidine kinase
VVGVLHDITEMRTAKEALHRANIQLALRVQQRTAQLAAAQAELTRKERLAVLGQLAGGLAHQIRNPLGTIVNAAAILQRELGRSASAGAQSALRMLHEEVWRADRIITDLIVYARVRQSIPTRAEVRDLLEQAVRTQDVGAHIRVVHDLPAKPLWVLVDPEQVLGALGNLISNAVEAMPQGGELSLGAQEAGNQVRLTIRETGPGISDAVREHLFHPLVSSKPWGLGLGLPTARALVENQGGRLEGVQSDSAGTRFEVLLPASS